MPYAVPHSSTLTLVHKMDIDLRSTIASAMETSNNPEPAVAPVEKPTTDPAAESAPKVQESAAEALKTEPTATAPEPTTASEAETESASPTEPEKPAVEDQFKKAPQSWKPTTREKWDALPTEVKAEVMRREKQIAAGLAESHTAREFVQQFAQIVQPFAARYQAAGLPPLKVVENMIRADHILSSAPAAAKAQYLAKMISDYGVDIQALDQALAGQTPQASDPTKDLQQRVEQMVEQRLAPIQELLNQRDMREKAQVQQTIERMANDSEKFPYFEDVRADMADLIELSAKRGVPISMEQAYTRAVASNPELNSLTRMRTETNRAQKALAASVSVSGAPTGKPTTIDANDLRGTLAASFDSIGGRI